MLDSPSLRALVGFSFFAGGGGVGSECSSAGVVKRERCAESGFALVGRGLLLPATGCWGAMLDARAPRGGRTRRLAMSASSVGLRGVFGGRTTRC